MCNCALSCSMRPVPQGERRCTLSLESDSPQIDMRVRIAKSAKTSEIKRQEATRSCNPTQTAFIAAGIYLPAIVAHRL